MAVGGVNFGILSIKAKDASKYGISDTDVAKINKNGDDKITYAELKAAGLEKYQGLTNHFNNVTNGALFASLGKVDGAQPAEQVGQTNPVNPIGNFVQNTLAFSGANPNRPEHRDFANAEAFGYNTNGKNLYMLG
ncbi:hypothetical protein IJZ97_01355 [bacterium]|nr:hypothetical protein [bacterium]